MVQFLPQCQWLLTQKKNLMFWNLDQKYRSPKSKLLEIPILDEKVGKKYEALQDLLQKCYNSLFVLYFIYIFGFYYYLLLKYEWFFF